MKKSKKKKAAKKISKRKPVKKAKKTKKSKKATRRPKPKKKAPKKAVKKKPKPKKKPLAMVRTQPASTPSPVAAPVPPPPPSIELKEGDAAPDFTAQTDDGRTVSLQDFQGKKLVLYFYPKDDTPGCTKEACAFRDGIQKIREKGAEVVGVSADDVASHGAFRDKFQLNFPLLADTDKKIVQDYGVWGEKNMYGRTYMGITRSTFLIDENGTIQRIFPKVNVETHYDEILAALG